jgi:hypothetical protein
MTPAPGSELPKALAVTDVAPNPFNPRTTIRYAMPHTGRITLRIYDLRGRLVRNLVDEVVAAGHHTTVWNGRGDDGAVTAAGVYFVRIDDGLGAATRKVVLAK